MPTGSAADNRGLPLAECHMPRELSDICIPVQGVLKDAMACIDRNGFGISLAVDERRHLKGTVSDGDIRRAVLSGCDVDTPLEVILSRKTNTPYSKPISALRGTGRDALLALMQANGVRQIPVLDPEGHVVDLALLDDFVAPENLPICAVVMAGGFGSRLRPLTDDVPKPMLPVGGKPLMERVIEQLQQAGIRHVSVTTHYKSEKIEEHFGDGSRFGVQIQYVNEEEPLGTGGALGLMSAPTGPLLIVNGDILTQVNFRAMLRFHQEHHAEMTVAVRRYSMQVPFGVVECEGALVRGVSEKPVMNFLVNAGIYLIEPSVYGYIPHGERFNMTDLIDWLMKAGRPVVSFPVIEYWLDIGRHADYEKAQEDVQKGRLPS